MLEWIASRVTTNIRELYGALTRVVSFASIRGDDVTLDVAKEALKDILPKAYQHPVTVEMVQAEVARQFGLHVNDLRGNRRTQDVAYARQIAMYLARDLTETSLPQIGARFGGRHHTTVIYAVDKIERQLKDGHDPQLQDLVELITARLKSPPLTPSVVRGRPPSHGPRSLLRPSTSLWTTCACGVDVLPQHRRNRLCFRGTRRAATEGTCWFCTPRPQRRAEASSPPVQQEKRRLSTSSTGAMTMTRRECPSLYSHKESG